MHELSAFQRDLLYAVAGLDHPHGLGIREALAGRYDTDISHSRLYRNLNALADHGLVAKSEKDARTNQYRLTSRGVNAVEDHHDWIEIQLDGGDAPATEEVVEDLPAAEGTNLTTGDGDA